MRSLINSFANLQSNLNLASVNLVSLLITLKINYLKLSENKMMRTFCRMFKIL